jgi:hypothetical protein
VEGEWPTIEDGCRRESLLEGFNLFAPPGVSFSHGRQVLSTGPVVRVIGSQETLVQREQALDEDRELVQGGDQFFAFVGRIGLESSRVAFKQRPLHFRTAAERRS